jgi:hypothetical protein
MKVSRFPDLLWHTESECFIMCKKRERDEDWILDLDYA